MTLTFLPLFTIAVEHAYYDGPLDEVEFLVPSDTAARLRNGRLVSRTRDGVLHVLFQANADGTPFSALTGHTLRFGLKVVTPAFFTVTASLPEPDTVAVYRNASSSTALDAASSLPRQPRVFPHTLVSSARPLTVTLVDTDDREWEALEVSAIDDRTAVSFDVSAGAPGVFEVREASGGAATETTRYHVDQELNAAHALAVIEIALNDAVYAAAAADAPAAFTLAFDAVADTLKYYVVVTDGPEAADLDRLAVADEAGAVAFTRVAAASFGDGDLSADQLTDDDSDVVLFKSTSDVPRRREAQTRFQLTRDADVIVSSLPQAADRASADVIVHVKKS